MGMPYCETDQAGVEIDKLVSINILNDTALARLGRERIESHQRGRDKRLVLFDQGPGFRTRRSYHDLRIFRSWHQWRRAHVSSTNKIAQRIRRDARVSFLKLSRSSRDLRSNRPLSQPPRSQYPPSGSGRS